MSVKKISIWAGVSVGVLLLIMLILAYQKGGPQPMHVIKQTIPVPLLTGAASEGEQ